MVTSLCVCTCMHAHSDTHMYTHTHVHTTHHIALFPGFYRLQYESDKSLGDKGTRLPTTYHTRTHTHTRDTHIHTLHTHMAYTHTTRVHTHTTHTHTHAHTYMPVQTWHTYTVMKSLTAHAHTHTHIHRWFQFSTTIPQCSWNSWKRHISQTAQNQSQSNSLLNGSKMLTSLWGKMIEIEKIHGNTHVIVFTC